MRMNIGISIRRTQSPLQVNAYVTPCLLRWAKCEAYQLHKDHILTLCGLLH